MRGSPFLIYPMGFKNECFLKSPVFIQRCAAFIGSIEGKNSPNLDSLDWMVHELLPKLPREIGLTIAGNGTRYDLGVVGKVLELKY